MYGNNKRLAQIKDHDGQVLEVYEIFTSIQGEGMFAGRPAVFVRFAGCMLNCDFCDTVFEGPETYAYPLKDLVVEIAKHSFAPERIDLVVLTGGEPMRQNIVPLITRLVEAEYEVQIETSGVAFFHPSWIERQPEWLVPYNYAHKWVTFVVSPKTKKVAKEYYEYADCWKYVLKPGYISKIDGLPLFETADKEIKQIARPRPNSLIYVQPCDFGNNEDNAVSTDAAIRVAMRHNYRLSIQQHKILGLR